MLLILILNEVSDSGIWSAAEQQQSSWNCLVSRITNVFVIDVGSGAVGRAPVISTARLVFTQGAAPYIKRLRCGQDRTDPWVDNFLFLKDLAETRETQKRTLEQETSRFQSREITVPELF